jgi:hypothetical protein
MGIRFQCPHCSESLNVKDQLAGRRGKCPHCRASIRIPASQSAAADVGELPVGSPETSPTASHLSRPPPALPRSSPVALPGVPPSQAATALPPLPPAASLGSSPPPAPGLPERAAPTHAVASRPSSLVDAPAAPPSGEPGGGLSAIQVRRARELQKRRQRQLLLSVALLLMALGLLSALVWVLARNTA